MIVPVKFSSNDCTLSVRFSINDCLIPVLFENFQTITVFPESDPYNGDYVVTPSTDEQCLETANKLMFDDVTIKSIPFFEVSNNTGGSTVYIGSDIEIT